MRELTKGLWQVAWSLDHRDARMANDVLRAADLLYAIDKLHSEHNAYEWEGTNGRQRLDLCAGCGEHWPCKTRQVLDGGES